MPKPKKAAKKKAAKKPAGVRVAGVRMKAKSATIRYERAIAKKAKQNPPPWPVATIAADKVLPYRDGRPGSARANPKRNTPPPDKAAASGAPLFLCSDDRTIPAQLAELDKWIDRTKNRRRDAYGITFALVRATNAHNAGDEWHAWKKAKAGEVHPAILSEAAARRELRRAPRAPRGPRRNPPSSSARAPRWMPFRTGGVLSTKVRELTRDKAGAYAIREVGAAAPFYVGEAHTPRGKPGAVKETLRWWMTICRHVHEWKPGKRARGFLEHYAKDLGGMKRIDEWVYRGNHDLEIAIWPVAPSKAIEREAQVLLAFEKAGTPAMHNKTITLTPKQAAKLKRSELPPAPF
jgi:hypothetical protein